MNAAGKFLRCFFLEKEKSQGVFTEAWLDSASQSLRQ